MLIGRSIDQSETDRAERGERGKEFELKALQNRWTPIYDFPFAICDRRSPIIDRRRVGMRLTGGKFNTACFEWLFELVS